MSSQLIYRCWCKATNRERSEPRRSQNWVVSKRAWFRVYADRIECGSWVIPFTDVKDAIVYTGREIFIPVRVLQLETEAGRFQFGFNPWASPSRHLPLKLKQENIQIRYSPFSIALRLLIISYLVYWVWDRWIKA